MFTLKIGFKLFKIYMERHFEGVHNICSISSPFLSFNLLRVFKRREERKGKRSKGKGKKCAKFSNFNFKALTGAFFIKGVF